MSMDRGDDTSRAADGPVRHLPVLLAEVLAGLAVRPGGLYADGTFGAGGYSRAILATPGTRVLALDRDPDAIAGGAELVADMAGRLTLEKARFADLDKVAPDAGFAALEDYLSDIPGRLYRAVAAGFHDPVTDVPLPLLELPYVHVRPLIDVHVTITEAARRDLGPFSIHYAPGYAAALP